ncbi:MAG: hypothetical protein GEU93_00860 [Propionibacteriales bacterium]|nr:hypothetical protein [Propionibacteriales bacterium]
MTHRDNASSPTVGWAIHGIGKLADIAIAPSITGQPDSVLAAVCSRDLRRAEEFAGRHGADGSASAYDDYPAMLADGDVDAVYIATPNALHAEHAVAAIRAGKHVLVEKPMTLSVEDARELVAAAAEAGVRLGVGFHLRHKATNRAGRDAIRAGRIGGRLEFIDIPFGAGQGVFPYGTWRSDPELAGGGTLLNQGAHAIDMAEFLSGQRIAEVTAEADRLPLDDVFVATCRLEDGALVTISSHQVQGGVPRTWVAVGRDGWLEGRSALASAAGDEVVLHAGDRTEVLVVGDRSAYDAEVDAFARAVLGTAPLIGDGEDGLRNVAVVDALYRAAREKRSIAV